MKSQPYPNPLMRLENMEKDVFFHHRKKLMKEAGFAVIEQFIKPNRPLVRNVSMWSGALTRVRHGLTFDSNIVVAGKYCIVLGKNNDDNIAKPP